MIGPDHIRNLLNNEKINFEGLDRNFDDISQDERVMDLFLSAVDNLFEHAAPREIADFTSSLKDRISDFSLSHDYLDVASHANETVYKITLVERRLRDAIEPEGFEEKAVSHEAPALKAPMALEYVDSVKAQSVLDLLSTDPSFEELYAYCQAHYPAFIDDVLLCSEIFKKHPKDLELIVSSEVMAASSEYAFSQLDLEEGALKLIKNYPHSAMQNFLIRSLFSPGLDHSILEKKNCLMLVAFHALSQEPELKSHVKEFSEFHFQSLKDGKIVFEFLILAKSLLESDSVETDKKGECFVKCLDLTPINPLAKKSEKSELKKQQFSKSIKKAKIMTASLKLLGKEDLISISVKSAEEISARLVGPLFDKLGVDRSLEHKVIDTFCSSRYPMGLFQYTAPMEDEAVMPSCKTFIEQVASGTLKEFRHTFNTHKTDLEAEQLAKWETGGITPLATGKVLVDSEDWQDLFLCGTEVQGSCQAVNGDPDLNKCLMGYCLDGKCRILCLKEAEDKPIIARAIMRIVLDEAGKAAIYMDDSYPFDYQEQLQAFAKQRADDIGLPLYVYGRDAKLSTTGCVAPYEYSDAAGGVQMGPYEFKGKVYSK
jgi:hypothetical protein